MIRPPVFPRGISGPTFAALRRVEQRRSGGCCSRSRFSQRVAAHPSDHLSLITHNSVRAGFTLLELLVVIGIIALLMVLVAPAFTNLKSAGDVNKAAHTIKGVLDTARTYAKANNTYTWVGFYEEATTASTPTNSAPPYPGKGRVLLAIVASKDGTKIYEDTDPAAPLPSDRITQIGKLVTIDNIHVTDIGNPSPTPTPTPVPDTLGDRPATPYTDSSPSDHWNRINSDSSDTTKFRFAAQNYTFYKTVRFGPGGEANLPYNVASPSPWPTLRRAGEIGMKPSRGATVDVNSTNTVAIQITGVGGNVKIYQR